MSTLELTPAAIATLVHTFYDDVRADPELAPIFNNAIGDQWEPHLARMVEFWCTVMLGHKSFQGNVFGTHMQLSGVEPRHFRRWLDLFMATVQRLFAPEVAEEFLIVARRIASSLQYGYYGKVVAE
ncbi:group III truncated hemoglobin [Rugamonas apoptosis]|uniref:Group III truncated hemoglobin n=1 Tax=Rugamonas apoptosis TaxID=2758570 RepID=A0A7W2IKI0_9BURK|nr:group III truncated hemoglobin [Rugamonas apoptosis]MBA5687391.1 group III truncated hemoglobin [Rugamonas apoptosis]